jgi:hypothetical protein
MDVLGTFSANGSSALLSVKSRERLYASLIVAGGDSFEGKLRIERSANQLEWELAKDSDGGDQEYIGTVGVPLIDVAAAPILLNETAHRMFYRVVCSAFAHDNVAYAIGDVPGDLLEVLMRDSKGFPILSRRDDGGLHVHVLLAVNRIEGTVDPDTADTVPVTIAGDVTIEDGSLSAPDGSVAIGAGVREGVDVITISAADIIGTGAGQFGHAAGYPLVVDIGADEICELVSAVLVSDRAVAAYTAGGDITVNETGGAALTGPVSAANSLGAATDTVATFVPLSVGATVRTPGAGLSLVSSDAFTNTHTNPGPAAGVVRVRVRYRVHTLSLT